MCTMYVCKTMRKVERALKSNDLNLPRKDRSNLRYYVGMHAVCRDGPSNNPKHQTSQNSTQRPWMMQRCKKSLNIVQTLYDALGATDQIAKGTRLLKDILNYSEADQISEVENGSEGRETGG